MLAALALLAAGCSPTASAPAADGPDRPSSSSPVVSASSSGGAGATFTNPVLGQGADPFVTVVRGRYYYVQSSSDGTGVTLRSSTSLATLELAPETEIVRASGGAPCCEYWAPEVHRIGSSWYVYVAADDGDNDHHRTYVFKAPKITGPYAFAGQLALPGDRWAIDATVLTGHGGPYVVWSGWPGGTNGEQDIYLARLSSPTAAGHAVRLSRPQYGWETESGTVGVKVNEGPAVLEHGGRVYLTYSASGCWTPDYALGMLSADGSADLLQASSWHKSATPVFSGGRGSGEYGTGHNSFFTSPDGRQTWMVYHAVTDAEGSCGSDREVYAQPVTFSRGRPVLGRPSGRFAALPLPAGDPGP